MLILWIASISWAHGRWRLFAKANTKGMTAWFFLLLLLLLSGYWNIIPLQSRSPCAKLNIAVWSGQHPLTGKETYCASRGTIHTLLDVCLCYFLMFIFIRSSPENWCLLFPPLPSLHFPPGYLNAAEYPCLLTRPKLRFCFYFWRPKKETHSARFVFQLMYQANK